MGRVLRYVASLSGCLVLLLGAAFGILQTGWGKDRLAAFFAASLSEPGTREFSIGRVEGFLPWSFDVREVALRDRDGPLLEVEHLEFDLDVSGALSGRYLVRNALASGVRVLRLPENEGAVPAAGGGLLFSSWPAGVVLEDFRITDLRVAPDVTGREIALEASGRIVPEAGKAVDVSLHVAGASESGLAAVAFLRQDPAADRVSFTAELSEPPDGIIAEWLQLPEGAPVLVQIAGEGQAHDWKAEFHAAFGTAECSGTLEVRSDTDIEIALAADANILTLVDPALASLTGPNVALQATGTIDGHTVALSSAVLTAKNAEVTARGSLGIADTQVDLAFDLEIADLSLYPTLGGEPTAGTLSATGNLRGDLLTPAFEIDLELYRFALLGHVAEAVHLTLSGLVAEADDDGPAGRIRGAGRITGLAGVPAEVEALLGPAPSFAFEVRRARGAPISVESLTIAGRNLDATANGSVDPESRAITTETTFVIPDGRPVLAELGISAGGRVDGRTTTVLGRRAESGTLEVFLAVRDVVLTTPLASALAGPVVTIDASLSLAENGPIEVKRFGMQSEQVTLTYHGVASREALELDGELVAEIRDLATLSSALGLPVSGSLHANARLSGPLENLALDTTVDVKSAGLGDIQVDRLLAVVSAQDVTRAATGTFAAEIEVAGAPPLSVGASFRLEDRRALSLSSLAASASEGTSVTGDFLVDLASGLVEGHAAVGIDSLTEFAAWAGVDMEGRATGGLTLSHDGGRQGARFVLAAQELMFGGVQQFSVDTFDSTGSVSDLRGTPEYSVSIDAAGVAGADLRIDRWHAGIDGDVERLAFETDLEGDVGVPARAGLTGVLARGDGAISATIERLAGVIAETPFALSVPLRARLGPSRSLQVEGAVDVGGGTAAVVISVNEAETDATITIGAFPLAVLEPWIRGAGASGHLDATLQVEGPSRATRGTIAANVADLRVDAGPEWVAVPPTSASLSGGWEGGVISADMRVDGLPGTSAEATATLPFALSLIPFEAAISTQTSLDASVRVLGDLAQLSLLLPLGEDRLRGRVDATIVAFGALDNPSMTGRAAVDDGRYESFETGAVIEALDLLLVFDNHEARIERLTATDGETGRLRGAGTIAFGTDESSRLDIRMDEFFLLRRDEISAPFTGTISATHKPSGLALGGVLSAQPVEVRIPEQMLARTVELEVTEINGADSVEAAATTQAMAADEPVRPIVLDLYLKPVRQLFVRGSGLDSEWSGALRLSGSSEAPKIEGALELVRGRFAIIDRSFNLVSGNIRFDGSSPADPELDLIAEAEAGDVLARVIVSGPVSAIDIAFESEPALPRDEVLAHVLFGKSVSDISAFQLAQVAQAVAVRSGGVDILGQVREVFGVDDISVTTGGDGAPGAALGVGKYVSNNVYLRAEQNLAEGGSKVGVEVEITDSITIESDVGTNSESDTWLNWQFRY